MIIYKTTNIVNGKIYIGKDKYNSPLYLGSGELLKLAIEKYGRNNFVKEVIEECDSKDVDNREKFWIEYYSARIRGVGYNIAAGGGGGDTISEHPDKENIGARHSEKMMGNKNAEGTIWTSDMRQTMSEIKSGEKNSMWGKQHTDNSKKIQSEKAFNRIDKECGHCGKIVDVSNFGRWHGDNCKIKVIL